MSIKMPETTRSPVSWGPDFGSDANAVITSRLVGSRLSRSRPRPRQQLVLSLVTVHAFAAVSVWVSTSLIWQMSWDYASITATWLLCAGITGGFSAWSARSESTIIVLRTGMATVACFFAGAAIVGYNSPHDLQLLLTVAALTVTGAAGRALVRRTHPQRVVALTADNEDLPAGWDAGKVVQHLPITRITASDADVLLGSIRAAVEQINPSSVDIIGEPGIPDALLRRIGWELRSQHISLRLLVGTGPVRPSRVHCAAEKDHTVLEITAPRQPFLVCLAKRAMDVVGSASLIVALSPLLILLAVLVKTTSPGTVLYRQERVGKDGMSFNILKFRTMVSGADAKLKELLEQQDRADTPLFKVDNDPRITKLGKVLRRYSLDELPQLFNVLGGSMSLVGPRPQRPAEVALYQGDAAHRLGVLPGMTGLWQVSGRSRLGWQAAQELDIAYAHNWSLGQDVKILARTARAVVGADGAY